MRPGPILITHLPASPSGSLLASAKRMEQEVRDLNQPFPELPAVAEVPTDNSDRRRRRGVANRAFRALKAQRNAQRDWIEVVADALNYMASSTPFLVLHVLWFTAWILWNTGALGSLGLRPFDPFPFGLLTMIVSLEAIFLSIFVLMAQRRESAIAEMREEISLQVSLRLEEEVTKTLQLVAGLYTRLGHRMAEDKELTEMLQPLDVEAIERELALQIQAASMRKRS
jgi:uncharacterized membrane protein